MLVKFISLKSFELNLAQKSQRIENKSKSDERERIVVLGKRYFSFLFKNKQTKKEYTYKGINNNLRLTWPAPAYQYQFSYCQHPVSAAQSAYDS